MSRAVRITVVKRSCHEDLASQYLQNPDIG